MKVRAQRGSVFVEADGPESNLEIGLVHGSTPRPQHAGGFVIERADRTDLISCLLALMEVLVDGKRTIAASQGVRLELR